MATATPHDLAPRDPALARMLILDELFDLSLYKARRENMDEESRKVMDELLQIETEHLAFGQGQRVGRTLGPTL